MAVVYFVGSLVDLGVLWFLQRQPGVQWEFVAVTNTVAALPGLMLAVALLYAAASFGSWSSAGLERALAALLLVLGLASAGLAGLAVLNYLSVVGAGSGPSGELIRATMMKTLGLCGLYFVLLVPAGIVGLRRTSP